jgi:hypothetical protein
MEYAVEMRSGAIICIPSFIKIGYLNLNSVAFPSTLQLKKVREDPPYYTASHAKKVATVRASDYTKLYSAVSLCSLRRGETWDRNKRQWTCKCSRHKSRFVLSISRSQPLGRRCVFRLRL